MSSDTLVPITDHEGDAVDRLVEQYKDKVKTEDLVKAFAKQYQEIEDTLQTLYLQRFLDNAVGIQLDKFGEIVVLGRNGFGDDDYRRLLKVKIGQNTSKGRLEQIINTTILLTQATEAHVQNLNRAQVAISVNAPIASDLVNFTYENLQKVPSAGVRINYIACYDPDEPFSFDGVGPFGAGFSSLAAPTTGGKFAFIHRQVTPFAFALSTTDQGSDNALGFGSVSDPLAGGMFEGL